MTVRLVRMMAKEFAGRFYEDNQRSLRFRAQWPDQSVYCARNWPHFVDIARGACAALLARPDYPEHLKEAIMSDLLEEHDRQQSPHAREVIQASFEYVDKAEIKSLNESHATLPAVSG